MRSEDAQPLRLRASGSERGPVAPARRTDELDRSIIEALQANGRESFRAIAARVGVSEATVRARYARLTAEGILQVVAVTNPLGLGYEQALVGVKTSGSPERVADEIARWPEADYVVATAGQFDLVVEVVAVRPAPSARADEPAARAAGRRLDRDLRLSGDVEAALRLGEWHAKGGHDEMSDHAGRDSRRPTQAAGERPSLAPLHAAWAAATSRRSSCAATAAISRTSSGKRYLDALAGLFSVNLGYGFGEEIGQAALEQMRELPFYTNWTYAHPRAIELAAEVASLAPGDLNRVFFCSGGSEAVESAWKLARQYFAVREGAPRRRGRARRDGRPAGRRPGAGSQVQGDRPQHRLPRHDVRRALDQRDRGAARAVRAARPRGAARQQHEPLPPAAGGDRGGVHGLPARRARADDPGDGSRDGLPRPHGAGPERRRLVHRAGGLLEAACASSATATTSCSRPTR